SPKKDLSWTGLLEFMDDNVTDYSRPSPTIASFLKASKNLDNIIKSKRSDKIKDEVGYIDVPPAAADLYLSPKKDLS
nr:hypothetical protein [Tanacetum cinerariifolium]